MSSLTRHININLISFIGCFGLAFYFYAFVFMNSFNAPFAPDDSKIFLKQYSQFKVGTLSTLEYYLGPTLYPHPKLTARIFTKVSELLFGGVNFRFLQIIGNFGFQILFILFVKSLESNKRYIYGLPIALLLFIPFQNSFWSISVSSLPYLMIFVYLSFYYITRDKVGLSLFFSALATFTSGQGFLCLFIIAIYLIAKSFSIGEINKKHLIWIFVSGLIFLLFFHLVLSNKEIGDKISIDGGPLLIRESITYFSCFIVSTLLNAFYGLTYNKYNAAFLGIAMLILSIGLIYSVRKNIFNKKDESLLMVGFILLMGILAVKGRMDEAGNYNIIPPRYELHSIIFIISLIHIYYQLGCQKGKRYIHWVILTLTLIVFIFRFDNYSFYSELKNTKKEILFNTITQNGNKPYVNYNNFQLIKNGILTGSYVLPSEYHSNIIDTPSTFNLIKSKPINRTNIIFERMINSELLVSFAWSSFESKSELKQFILFVDDFTKDEFMFPVFHSANLSEREKRKYKKKLILNPISEKHALYLLKNDELLKSGDYKCYIIQHKQNVWFKKYINKISI